MIVFTELLPMWKGDALLGAAMFYCPYIPMLTIGKAPQQIKFKTRYDT